MFSITKNSIITLFLLKVKIQDGFQYPAIILLNHDPDRKKDFMKLSVIEGNICGLNLRRGAHSIGHYFQDGRHFSKWPPVFEVRTLKIKEIINFNYLNIDSYVFDNSKTEY